MCFDGSAPKDFVSFGVFDYLLLTSPGQLPPLAILDPVGGWSSPPPGEVTEAGTTDLSLRAGRQGPAAA
jgi:hypothetical protein